MSEGLGERREALHGDLKNLLPSKENSSRKEKRVVRERRGGEEALNGSMTMEETGVDSLRDTASMSQEIEGEKERRP